MKVAAKIILFGLLITAVVAFFAFDLQRFITIDELKNQELAFQSAFAANPIQVALIYMGLTIVFVVCALPGVALVMMISGAIFGVALGSVLCSIALTIGAILSLLSARFLVRDVIETKFRAQAAIVNRGIERDGAFYLMTMRLLPMMPYFITNLLLGLTKMSVRKFWITSQLSSLPAILIYANAGRELSKITSLAQIWSPKLFISLTLLALFPTIAKWIANVLRPKSV